MTAPESPTFVIVTPMKNEGPFVLEWVAHNKAIGADTIVVFSNDCDDGSDLLLDRLDAVGAIRHFDNTSSRPVSPQKLAYRRFMKMDFAQTHDWIVVIDADELINVKTGDHTLQALVKAVPEAKTLSMTWRLFGNNGVTEYENRFLTDQFRMAAREITRRPHQAWGFKTMFRSGLWDHIGVHRPKHPTVDTFPETAWFNGSGQPMPERYFTQSWRSAVDSVGYDLVQLNHYALKSCESYLVKKARGRAHHTGDSLGLDYWNMMNQNVVEDTSIDAISARKAAIFEELLQDSETRRLHEECCARHKARIEDMKRDPAIGALMEDLTKG